MGAKLAAAFSVGAVVGLAKKTVEYADTIDETASRIGVGTKALQEWNFAAQQSGASTEKLMTFVERSSAAASDPKNAAAFAAMGINPQGMTPESLFRSVAGWAKGRSVTDVSEGLSGVMDARAVRPMLNLLTSDLDAAAASANKLGAVMEEGTVKRLAALNDQLAIVGQVLMANFAVALIEAGKIAIAAFAQIKGAGSWWGAMTANITKGNFERVMQTPWGNTAELKKRLEGLLPDASMRATAQSEYSDAIDSANDLIERLSKMSGATNLPTITVAQDQARQRASVGEQIKSDSLLSVGNFLGSGRDAISSIQRQQLTALNKIEMNTRRKPEESGSLIIP